jgi:hypothetical protein
MGPENWTSVDVEFPKAITIGVHELYSGKCRTYHPAQRLQIAAYNPTTRIYRTLAGDVTGAHSGFFFSPQTAREWIVPFQSGPSDYSIIRGVRLYPDSSIGLKID